MVISWVDGQNKKITAIYWSNGLNKQEIENYGKDSDFIQIWYPWNLSDDIYEKYHELITYLELEGEWKGNAYSSWIDLLQNEEVILQQFSKTRKYEVRRAKERDNLKVLFQDALEDAELSEFEEYYNRFADQTDGLMGHRLDIEKVKALNKQKQFVLAKILDSESNVLVMHGYIIDMEKKIAALFSSSSHFREENEKKALISRANGLLHYESMLYFKNRGLNIYDFGGIYLGNINLRYANVTSFKQSFGGKKMVFQNGIIIPIREAKIIDCNLSKIGKMISNADIVLWGYSSFGKYIEKQLKTIFSKECKYIIDNKLCESNKKCVNEQVLNEIEADNVLILVSTSIENCCKIIAQDNVKKFVENNKLLCLRRMLYVDKF